MTERHNRSRDGDPGSLWRRNLPNARDPAIAGDCVRPRDREASGNVVGRVGGSRRVCPCIIRECRAGSCYRIDVFGDGVAVDRNVVEANSAPLVGMLIVDPVLTKVSPLVLLICHGTLPAPPVRFSVEFVISSVRVAEPFDVNVFEQFTVLPCVLNWPPA